MGKREVKACNIQRAKLPAEWVEGGQQEVHKEVLLLLYIRRVQVRGMLKCARSKKRRSVSMPMKLGKGWL